MIKFPNSHIWSKWWLEGMGQRKRKEKQLICNDSYYVPGTVLTHLPIMLLTKLQARNAHLTCFTRGSVGSKKVCDWPSIVNGKWLSLVQTLTFWRQSSSETIVYSLAYWGLYKHIHLLCLSLTNYMNTLQPTASPTRKVSNQPSFCPLCSTAPVLSSSFAFPPCFLSAPMHGNSKSP